jgi:hypothetical protein
MAARTGNNNMRFYCIVLMPIGRNIDESSNVVELILEKSGAPYSPGRFPEWKEELVKLNT